jgi:hypothetical protein
MQVALCDLCTVVDIKTVCDLGSYGTGEVRPLSVNNVMYYS